MSYQVIARKWRPKTFDELAGQSHVSQTLLNALRHGRLPHALLFTGPRGTGKTSSARILAKSLRCPDAKEFIPCNTCNECEDIAAGRSVDVIEIDGASNNGVDAIRELRDSVGYMPSSGNRKVYIIDEVHMLSTSAFNALLKTLEEPPEHVVFVLATTEVHKIPNTILSRCQRFDFRRIPLRTIADYMMQICKSEDVTAEPQALWAIARQGDGSMRDSQSLLDQVITFCDGKVTLQKVVEVLGLTDRQLLNRTLSALLDRDPKVMIDVVEQIFRAGYDPKVFAQDLLEELRNTLMVKLAPEEAARLVDLPDAELDNLKALAERLSAEDIHMLFDMALKGANDIPRAQDPRVVLEMLLMRMASAPHVEDLMQALKGGGTRMAQQVASTKPRGPIEKGARYEASEPKSTGVVLGGTSKGELGEGNKVDGTFSAGTSNDQWADLVGRIKRINGVFAAQLENTYLISVKNKKVTIGVPPKMKFLADKMKEGDTLRKLVTYMTTFWGPGYSVDVQVGTAATTETGGESALSPRELEQKKKTDAEAEIRRQVENHPLVKTAKDVFKTEIQSIKEST